eukprot:5638320-Alexandrium_andersonii.AAC.1
MASIREDNNDSAANHLDNAGGTEEKGKGKAGKGKEENGKGNTGNGNAKEDRLQKALNARIALSSLAVVANANGRP